MKAVILSASTLMYSATLVGELPQQTAISSAPMPTNFCGQAQMLSWFLNSEIGRQIQQRQQAAIAQAIAERENAAPRK